MTEQEKKENSVDKMAYCILGKDGRTKLSTRDWLITNYILRKLYDEGYRREEDIFKETAKSLIQDFVRLCNMEDVTVDLVKIHLLTMAKVIGVEVEE